MTTHDELDRLASEMKARGEDGLRLRAVERARSFKRTWVEMAEVLVKVRARHAYLDWGYQEFYAYCEGELRIKRATVEKLTGSYVALERHAPNVLQRDGVAQSIPTIDAVDYFARALRGEPGSGPANDAREGDEELPREVIDELRQAVFEEGAPVASLRRRFDPVIRPTSEEERKIDNARKASAAAKRLSEQVTEIEGIDADVVAAAESALEALRRELDGVVAAGVVSERPKRRAG